MLEFRTVIIKKYMVKGISIFGETKIMNVNTSFLSFLSLVFPLIMRRRFQQIDVLETLNVLVTVSGK